jgi:polysaccharide export outer membrane protein
MLNRVKMNLNKFPGIRIAFITLAFYGLLSLTSCTTYKNIAYFKNVQDSSRLDQQGIIIGAVDYEDIKIQPNDIVNITIQTIDPAVNNVLGSADLSTSFAQGSRSEQVKDIAGYLVDQDGFIELPVAGKIRLAGATTAEAREIIRQKALKYYKEPVVNVRIVNFKVTVLGEVARPGTYLVNGEKATLLDALGQAGDMTIFGKRNNVLLAREEKGKQRMVRFDLNSTDIFESPYFYLRQGDMIYVQPSKGKAAANDAALARTYTVVASTLSLLVVLVTRLR